MEVSVPNSYFNLRTWDDQILMTFSNSAEIRPSNLRCRYRWECLD